MKLYKMLRSEYEDITPQNDSHYIIKDEAYLYNGDKQLTYEKYVLNFPIGGRIFYDDGDNGATYTFYGASGNVITDTSISGLANAVSYTVKGTPTKDRWYVYDNTSHSNIGGVTADSGLVSSIYWGWYNTPIGSSGVPPRLTNAIGDGKRNTAAVLAKGVPTDYTPNIWGYIKACRDNSLNGCNDWIILDELEQDKLRASGLVNWYSSKYVWSSVENSRNSGYYWHYGASEWFGNDKYADYCAFAARAF